MEEEDCGRRRRAVRASEVQGQSLEGVLLRDERRVQGGEVPYHVYAHALGDGVMQYVPPPAELLPEGGGIGVDHPRDDLEGSAERDHERKRMRSPPPAVVVRVVVVPYPASVGVSQARGAWIMREEGEDGIVVVSRLLGGEERTQVYETQEVLWAMGARGGILEAEYTNH